MTAASSIAQNIGVKTPRKSDTSCSFRCTLCFVGAISVGVVGVRYYAETRGSIPTFALKGDSARIEIRANDRTTDQQ